MARNVKSKLVKLVKILVADQISSFKLVQCGVHCTPLSLYARKRTFENMRPAKVQICLRRDSHRLIRILNGDILPKFAKFHYKNKPIQIY